VNNAGVNLGKRTVTPDGLEATLATNHLGPFLLTHLLLDVLKASAPSRIVIVGSGGHRAGKIRLDDLQFERKYSAFQSYSQSKLANVLFTYELARRLKGTGVDVNCADPGVVATSLGSDQLLYRLVVKWPWLQTPAEGAQTAIHLASAPELTGITGKYFIKSQEKPSSKASYDERLARELWDVSARLTGLEAAAARAA
jgi:NAD(P)-dependent dehydrogenase (short-subunit alcohol dehydrogenase family)